MTRTILFINIEGERDACSRGGTTRTSWSRIGGFHPRFIQPRRRCVPQPEADSAVSILNESTPASAPTGLAVTRNHCEFARRDVLRVQRG